MGWNNFTHARLVSWLSRILDTWAETGKIIDIDPELIIEVVSPSNSWDDIQTKIQEYFTIGTNEVWVISPINRNVTVYHSLKQITSFSATENEVVTSKKLPGFELSLNELADRIDELGTLEDE